MFKTYNNLEDATHAQPRVTALLSCQDNLMPASWHMPISKSPFRYAVAVREENYTHQLIQEHKSFTLNFLPFEHFETVNLMGKLHGDMDSKLAKSGLYIEGNDIMVTYCSALQTLSMSVMYAIPIKMATILYL